MFFDKPHFRIMGDRALLVEWGDEINPLINQAVRELFFSLDNQKIQGVAELVPGYCSLLIQYDPLRLPLSTLQEIITLSSRKSQAVYIADSRTHKIPVIYGGSYGPDLQWVADYHDLSIPEVIRLHTGTVYRGYMIGFTPGFPYLGELPDAIAAPRKEKPRTLVPRGSVAIAQKQTGIYPSDSPGGWQILGWTAVKLFNPFANPPGLIGMGDQVTFVSVTEEEMKQWVL
ncbi:MAG: 5-oxoprolinase subunit PxpB [Desulfobacteraceae bacterium]|nr:MAG: 5-oxoprolinase subunit PxpB [Desulfobacteraceae bacterium]